MLRIAEHYNTKVPHFSTQCGTLQSILNIAPGGIEPSSKVPETFVLSIERRGRTRGHCATDRRKSQARCLQNYISDRICPEKIFDKRRRANPHAGYRRSAYYRGIHFTGVRINSPASFPLCLLPTPLRNSVAPGTFTSYLIYSASSCHSSIFLNPYFIGTDVLSVRFSRDSHTTEVSISR